MSTKITYNGKTTELADGYIATLPCKDYKMATDIVVEAPEGSGVSIAEWNGSIAYNPDAIVIFEKIYYVCIKATTAGSVVNNPSVTPSEWKRLNGAYKGEYDSSATYYLGDIVLSNNNLYQSKIDNPETAPDNDMASRWTLLHESSGGGAELNIAYGDTAPEDTSKLWVKTAEPSAVKVSSELETKVGEGEGEIAMETLSAAMATGLDAYAQAQVGTKIYLFGGGSSHTNQKMYYGTYHNKIQCFDIETETITTLSAETAGNASLYIASAVVGTKVYLFGGKKGGGGVTTIQCFDTKTETISTLSTTLIYQFSTYGSVAVTMGTKIYLISGCDKYTATVLLFDTETEALTNLGMYFLGSGNQTPSGAVGVVGTKIYLFGGYYTNGYNKIFRIDTETNTCTTLSTTLAEPRGRMATLTVGSNIYLLGGMTNDYTAMNKISLFDAKTETIKDLDVTLPYTYWCAGVQGTGEELYMLGTEDNNHIVKFTPSVKTVLPTNNVQIHTQDGKNKFALIDTSALKVEVGVNKVYKGNADGIGEQVEAALHNGTSWVTI